jgi:hypothetical protein
MNYYYIKVGNQKERRVCEAEFIQYENLCGFHIGHGTRVTNGFIFVTRLGLNIEGRVKKRRNKNEQCK